MATLAPHPLLPAEGWVESSLGVLGRRSVAQDASLLPGRIGDVLIFHPAGGQQSGLLRGEGVDRPGVPAGDPVPRRSVTRPLLVTAQAFSRTHVGETRRGVHHLLRLYRSPKEVHIHARHPPVQVTAENNAPGFLDGVEGVDAHGSHTVRGELHEAHGISLPPDIEAVSVPQVVMAYVLVQLPASQGHGCRTAQAHVSWLVPVLVPGIRVGSMIQEESSHLRVTSAVGHGKGRPPLMGGGVRIRSRFQEDLRYLQATPAGCHMEWGSAPLVPDRNVSPSGQERLHHGRVVVMGSAVQGCASVPTDAVGISSGPEEEDGDLTLVPDPGPAKGGVAGRVRGLDGGG